jgi:Bacteriophage HK97-gp10, putative tail-component
LRLLLNPRLDRELLRSAEMHKALMVAAEEAKTFAQAIAPVDTGDYKRSFVVVLDDDGVVKLGNTDWKAHFIEWGTVTWKPHHVLKRAVRTTGLRFREDRHR